MSLPIFFKDEEENLFIKLGRELSENLIRQTCTVYSIDVSKTESNIYGESKNKAYDIYENVIGRIQIADADVEFEGGVRRLAKGDMNLWIYNEHLEEISLTIKVGDFIGHNGKFYEVYDAGFRKDSVDRKLAGEREYYTEVLAKVVDEAVFMSTIGNDRR